MIVLKKPDPDTAFRAYITELLKRARLHRATYFNSFCERYAKQWGLTLVDGKYVHGRSAPKPKLSVEGSAEV